ncbi:hypothetical protein A6U85_24835 [Agrobacterium sp. 13-626]|nr:hypothetical protein A6U85_24835 [Agrobacterium sp. 13-626]
MSEYGNSRSLEPIVGLVETLSASHKEHLARHAIALHRHLRAVAEEKYSVWQGQTARAENCPERELAHLDYVGAMIGLHAQQTVVSSLVSVLGFVPDAE